MANNVCKSVLITGVSASGKSAVCEELKRMGERAFDIERIGLFSHISKKTGKPAKRRISDDPEKFQEYMWICNVNKLRKLIHDNDDAAVYYCGIGYNLDEIMPLFDKVVLLVASDRVTRDRLTNRTSNTFGKTKEMQEWIFSWKKNLEDHIRSYGVIEIDADQSLSKVASEIVNRVSYTGKV